MDYNSQFQINFENFWNIDYNPKLESFLSHQLFPKINLGYSEDFQHIKKW